jgi:hypothetical protein
VIEIISDTEFAGESEEDKQQGISSESESEGEDKAKDRDNNNDSQEVMAGMLTHLHQSILGR